MACAICRHPLEDHEPAIQVLGELPFETVKCLMQHQWQKDVTRIVYAHAEHYHDQMLFEAPPPLKEQLQYIEADIQNHRSKFVMHYLHAVGEVHRIEEVGNTRVTMADEMLLRIKLEDALAYEPPSDLDAVFRQPKPFAWKGTTLPEQSQRYLEMAQGSISRESHMFGHGYIQEAIEHKLITVISIVVRLYGAVTSDEFVMLVPKAPDPMWCWSQKTELIEEFHGLTLLDLL
ncbi:hypothetical protein F4808DRAFT_404585 [Astrocystis sublimbata]|nr:hypothetical protein F4808DRAFT_404585 [Astrocystis sublimbata]